MKRLLNISIFMFLFLTLFGCQKSTSRTNPIVEKDFGLLKNENDSIAAELKLSEFTSWKELIRRTDQIVCNDSLPKIILKYDSLIKRVYLRNPCYEGLACILIKQKNVIEIHNDTINKSGKKFYSLDSLPQILKRDLENNGKNPSLCDNPESLLIYVSYDTYEVEKISHTLNRLTTSFEKITSRTDVKIWLREKFENLDPPPPPPKEPEEIELIQEK